MLAVVLESKFPSITLDYNYTVGKNGAHYTVYQ